MIELADALVGSKITKKAMNTAAMITRRIRTRIS